MFHHRHTNDSSGCRDGDWSRRRLFRGRVSIATIGLIGCLTLGSSVSGQELQLSGPENRQAVSVDKEQARAAIQWLASLAIQKTPRTFDGDRGWGDTKQVWSGVKIRRDGLKLKTNRRYREQEHGRWLKYQVALPESAAAISITEVTQEPLQLTGQQRWNVRASIVAPMKFEATVQRWNIGIKLYSMTISGVMRVRLTTSTSIGFQADYGEIPPAFIVDPKVQEAQMTLEHFEVERISRIGGDVAEQWGKVIEEVLVDRFVKKQNSKLVDKLNRAIDKERDDLRLSAADWFASWQDD